MLNPTHVSDPIPRHLVMTKRNSFTLIQNWHVSGEGFFFFFLKLKHVNYNLYINKQLSLWISGLAALLYLGTC